MRFNQHYLVCDGGAGWAWLKLFLPAATWTRSAEGTVRFNGTRPVIEQTCCECHSHDQKLEELLEDGHQSSIH